MRLEVLVENFGTRHAGLASPPTRPIAAHSICKHRVPFFSVAGWRIPRRPENALNALFEQRSGPEESRAAFHVLGHDHSQKRCYGTGNDARDLFKRRWVQLRKE